MVDFYEGKIVFADRPKPVCPYPVSFRISPQKYYSEKYENLPEDKEWPEANEDWLKKEIVAVILRSRWGNRRCREEMSGDPEHLIVLCKIGLEDAAKDIEKKLKQ